jgi:hypothetical protein
MASSRTHRSLCLAVLLTVAVIGCGGGGSGGDISGARAGFAGTGTVVVTVTDALGAPASGASVSVSSTAPGRSWWYVEHSADANGQLWLTRTPVGTIRASSRADSPVNAQGGATEAELAVNAQLDLTITLRPDSNWEGGPGGIAAARVESVSSDGRSLEFSMRVLGLGTDPTYYSIAPCTPDSANDTADCVIGPEGFDAPYAAESVSYTPLGGDAAPSFSAALLLDQSRYLTADDPWDNRLFDLKYFLVSKAPTDRVLLAAFASDDGASGIMSQLPQKPVTLFPVENPGFTTASNGLFTTIDSLESLEGGAAPLYQSIDAMLDYVAAHTSVEDRRAIVILTDGTDDTCGSSTQCDDARNRVGDKSRALDVPLVIIALNGGSWFSDGAFRMARLGTRSSGIVLWAINESDLGPVFGRLPAILNGTEATYEARFRIESPMDGAFQSGRTVTGYLDWGWAALPFAVEIP